MMGSDRNEKGKKKGRKQELICSALTQTAGIVMYVMSGCLVYTVAAKWVLNLNLCPPLKFEIFLV